MTTPNDRLKQARLSAGYGTAREAAAALGIAESTYTQHENGLRGFPASRAPTYARKFKVSEEWLLYGKGGDDAADPLPSAEVLEKMVQEAIETEVTVQTRLSDLPRMLASNLYEQLARYAADPGVVDFWAEKTARDRAAQSPSATTEGAEEESRTA